MKDEIVFHKRNGVKRSYTNKTKQETLRSFTMRRHCDVKCVLLILYRYSSSIYRHLWYKQTPTRLLSNVLFNHTSYE